MTIDLETLTATGAFVTAMSGILILFAWFQDQSVRGILWWASASMINAVGIALLVVEHLMPNPGIAAIAGTFLSLNAPLIWCAARLLDNRPIRPVLAAAGPVLGVLLNAIPFVRENPAYPNMIGYLIVAAYALAAINDFWRQRGDGLHARGPLIALLGLHGLVFLGGFVEGLVSNVDYDRAPPLTTFFGLVHVETLIFSMGSAIFLIAFARERKALAYKIASGIDVLTGLANRRAFLKHAEDCLQVCLLHDAPLSLVAFDLDRFKSINDTYGHAIGDQVLQLFGDVVRRLVRPSDLVGRIGGEEFAIVMPNSSAGAAYVIADRIRLAFAEAGQSIAGRAVNGTLSAGVATAHPRSTLDSLLEAADNALYRAKTLGRNRIESEERRQRGESPSATIIRVA